MHSWRGIYSSVGEVHDALHRDTASLPPMKAEAYLAHSEWHWRLVTQVAGRSATWLTLISNRSSRVDKGRGDSTTSKRVGKRAKPTDGRVDQAEAEAQARQTMRGTCQGVSGTGRAGLVLRQSIMSLMLGSFLSSWSGVAEGRHHCRGPLYGIGR